MSGTMRVAFDMDGVLADLHGAYVRAARELFPAIDAAVLQSPNAGASPPTEEDDQPSDEVPPTDTRPELTRHQSQAVWRQLCATPNFWETLDEIEPGAIARLSALAVER